ncbi:MAG: PEP-CTERM sorting domain-containing protein [Planctomycetales bacterium]|nr:PEP-CTERM sorting domain-containing protein [Planctomycetales bacterium]
MFAATLLAQPALAEWRLVGSSGNQHSSNPADWTMAVVGADDENLYAVDTGTGGLTYVRGLRNNVDAELAGNGWTAPFWGESYRDGQGIAYNFDTGLLYARNGTTGYRTDVNDPRSYDTRLIETYNPGSSISFFQDPPTKVFNALTDGLFAPASSQGNGGVNPDYPIDGNDWSESRGFTFDQERGYFVLAAAKGGFAMGTWDPTDTSPNSSVLVTNSAVGLKGITYYDTNLDGATTANRIFAGPRNGNQFYELSNVTDATYLTDLSGGAPASIALLDGPAGNITGVLGMSQDPSTGDVYAAVGIENEDFRHLIRFNAADLDAFNAATDLFITADYIGQFDNYITALAFVEVETATDNPDFNNDGWIDGLDYLIWAGNYDTIGSGTQATGDANFDTNVDGLDYLIWAGAFGQHPGGSSAVPEPGTFALAGLAVAGLLAARRRRS